MGFQKFGGTLLGGPHNKDDIGVPSFWETTMFRNAVMVLMLMGVLIAPTHGRIPGEHLYHYPKLRAFRSGGHAAHAEEFNIYLLPLQCSSRNGVAPGYMQHGNSTCAAHGVSSAACMRAFCFGRSAV